MVISQFPARFGKYILLDRINAGGMAEVFRAKVTGAEKFERLVAIKCMLPQLLEDDHFKTMFIDEAKLAAQLSHANIVQIYELGELKRTEQQFLYIAMELISGRDLRHILRSARTNLTPIPVGFAAYVISKAAAGLDFAHRKLGVDGSPLNLVHRDVSPQNILVSYDGEVKVVDFGIAKAEMRNTETQAGVLKGKFAYMAPEQVVGGAIDRRADIFALGSVLYEVITGQRLFTGENDLSVLEKVRAAKLPDLRTLLPEGGEELEHVLLRALAKKPEDRYTYGSEMAEDLEHLLIEDRSIFGYKRAAQFMQTLYADEVTQLAEQLRLYADITVDSCVVTIGDTNPGHDSRYVFDSTFAGTVTGSVPGPGTGAGTRPMAREPMHNEPSGYYEDDEPMESPSQVRRRPARQPATGGHTRPALRRVTNSQNAGHTSVERAPVTSRTSRVLSNLRMGLMLSAFVTAVLVILVSMKVPISSHPGAFKGIEDLKPFVQNLTTKIADQVQVHSDMPIGANTGGSAAPAANEAEDGSAADEGDDGGKNRFGWIQVRMSPERGRVFIDNKEVGPLPLAPKRLRVGQHEIKILDDNGVLRGKVAFVQVTTRNTRKTPKVVATY